MSVSESLRKLDF